MEALNAEQVIDCLRGGVAYLRPALRVAVSLDDPTTLDTSSLKKRERAVESERDSIGVVRRQQ